MHIAPWIAVIALLAACDTASPDLANSLPEDQLTPPLPQTMTLQMTDPLVPGSTVQIGITNAPPNSNVFIIKSNGVVGAGGCPPQIGGDCLGITAGTSGYSVVTTIRTNSSGTGNFQATLPMTIPSGAQLAFQGVHAATPTGSNAIGRIVGGGGGPCVEDSFEDNDTPTTSATGVPGPADAQACPSDEDYFNYSVPNGQQIMIEFMFDDAGDGDLDVELYDTTGTSLDTSFGVTDIETVTWTNTTGGTATVVVNPRIYSDTGPTGIAYTFQASLSTPLICGPDSLEDDDDAVGAPMITAGAYSPLSGCTNDEWDWHRIDLASGQVITVTLDYDYLDGDVDAYLFDAAQPNDETVINSTYLARAYSGLAPDAFTFTVATSGTYWLLAKHYADAGGLLVDGTAYDMLIQVQ